MPSKKPERYEFKITAGGRTFLTAGWRTTPALGIFKMNEARNNEVVVEYIPMMIMAGIALWSPFATLEQAHTFNALVAAEKRLFVGTPDLEEFYAHAGGKDAARALLEKIAKRVEAKPTEKELA